eukprot:4491053-Pleurochrysis_carterae.AAC.2
MHTRALIRGLRRTSRASDSAVALSIRQGGIGSARATGAHRGQGTVVPACPCDVNGRRFRIGITHVTTLRTAVGGGMARRHMGLGSRLSSGDGGSGLTRWNN